ncbi:MAG: alpha-galactosidase, partial [Acidimicrobiales bacterium]|nr:alpha-galactosidase [Acidimicrobiales bacterium]
PTTIEVRYHTHNSDVISESVDFSLGEINTRKGITFYISSSNLGSGTKIDLNVTNNTGDSIRVSHVAIQFGAQVEKVIENGYQSWSPVLRTVPGSVNQARLSQAPFILGTNFADIHSLERQPGIDQYLIARCHDYDIGMVFLDGRAHLGTFDIDGSHIGARALLDDIELSDSSNRLLSPLWFGPGKAGQLFSELAKLWGQYCGARTNSYSPVGWCSWYQYFADIKPEMIDKAINLSKGRAIDLIQLDDGYQSQIGDWLDPNESWKDRYPQIAKVIKENGFSAGIWTAPFLVSEKSKLFESHPEWIARTPNGEKFLEAVFNPMSWGGWTYALDTTHEGALDYLRETFSTLRQEGFDYHKIDFCFSATLEGSRLRDKEMTRAQALYEGIKAVREGIGDDAFLLGCGCPFGPAVGLVDAMRVSPDTAPFYSPMGSVGGFEESSPAAKNAITASLLRAPLHRRIFINDPDCLLLRPSSIVMSENEREILRATVVGSGSYIVVSDDLELYQEKQFQILSETIALGNPDEVLDIEDPFATPLTINSASFTLSIDPWGDSRPESDLERETIIEAVEESGPWALLFRASP